jgi:phosphoribosylglycinamide formyltransferase-1
MKNKKINLAVLISGRGSNLKAIIDSIKSGYLDNAQLKVVIANKEAPGIKFAEEFGVPTYVVPRVVDGKKISREEHDEKVMKILERYDIDLVCMAGYLQVLTPKFIEKYRNRVMNIHPSLLPAFPGTIHAQREAIEYGVKISGCTVHFADEGIDTGPIIVQATVPVKDDDTEETLANRILEFEHIIYPKAIKMFAEGRLKVIGRKVRVERKIDVEIIATNTLDRNIIEKELRKIGVEERAVENFLDKSEVYAIKIRDITPREALIIKQEMLALGGDCATPKECILNSLVPVDVVVIGNKRQIKKLIMILKNQIFELPIVAEKLMKIIEN